MTILIDARYVGASLRAVRRPGGITARQVCMVLGVTGRTLHKYERGKEIIPQEMLNRIIRNGIRALVSRM